MAEYLDVTALYDRLLRTLGEAEGMALELSEALRQTQRLVEQSDALLRQAQRDYYPTDRHIGMP
jgi:hypothetical protein